MERNNFNFSFEDLRLFQKNLDFIDYIYKVVANFPDNEKDNLVLKLKNASQSIAINIAEGSGENKTQYINSLRIAKAAIRECIVYVLIAKRQDLIDEITEEEIRNKLIEISKMISGLIRSLKNPDQYRSKENNNNSYNNIQIPENSFNNE